MKFTICSLRNRLWNNRVRADRTAPRTTVVKSDGTNLSTTCLKWLPCKYTVQRWIHSEFTKCLPKSDLSSCCWAWTRTLPKGYFGSASSGHLPNWRCNIQSFFFFLSIHLKGKKKQTLPKHFRIHNKHLTQHCVIYGIFSYTLNSHLIIIIIIGKQDLNVKRILSRSFPSECWIQPPHLAVSY